jgi:hypothetical protein
MPRPLSFFAGGSSKSESQLSSLNWKKRSMGMGRVNKRFTVDFNGMQVSYPTYVRLSRLQVMYFLIRATLSRTRLD